MKRVITRVFFAAFVLGCIEGTAWLSLKILNNTHGYTYRPIQTRRLEETNLQQIKAFIHRDTIYHTYSKDLGWDIIPDSSWLCHNSNRDGIRGDREYSHKPGPGVLRILTFGDSFTHGDMVANTETWQEVITRSFTNQVEALNFGVRGYGLDQAYLKYIKRSARWNPHVVFIDFMSENIFRHLNVYRPFYLVKSKFPLTKPRFTLDSEGNLKLLENPMGKLDEYQNLIDNPEATLKSLGKHDYFYKWRYHHGPLDNLSIVRLAKILKWDWVGMGQVKWQGQYNPHGEGFKVTLGIMEAFYNEVKQHGAVPIIVLFPYFEDIDQFRSTGTVSYEPLRRALDEKGLEYIDIINAFAGPGADYDRKKLAAYHYTALGNQIVGTYIADIIRQKGWIDRLIHQPNRLPVDE